MKSQRHVLQCNKTVTKTMRRTLRSPKLPGEYTIVEFRVRKYLGLWAKMPPKVMKMAQI